MTPVNHRLIDQRLVTKNDIICREVVTYEHSRRETNEEQSVSSVRQSTHRVAHLRTCLIIQKKSSTTTSTNQPTLRQTTLTNMTRSYTLLLLLLAPLSGSAFVPRFQPASNPSTTAVFMSDSVADAQLVLTGNNIDLTPALEEYAEKRIGGLLDKLGGGGLVRECEIHLSVSKNPKVRRQASQKTTGASRVLNFWFVVSIE